MNDIRILHIMDKVSVDGSRIHGPARQVASRVPYYPRDRFRVMLLNLRGEDAACGVLRRNGIEVVSLNRGKFDPFALFDILRLIGEWRPSVLHLHGYASFNFGRVAGRLKGVPVVVQEHFVDERLPAYQKALDFLLRRRQNKALAVSEAVMKFMVEERYIPRADVEVLFNGVPVERIARPAPERLQALRRQLGIPEGARVLGTAGRLAEMKGHHHFLQAARIVAGQVENVRFVVMGEGPMAAALQHQARGDGLDGKVIFTGYQENVAPYLSLFDAGVVASTFNEGFNTVGIEMFAVGVPLIITDLPCFHDVYLHEGNVLMVPPGDPPALAQAALRLLGEPQLRERLLAGGRETVEKCRMDKVAARYVEIYRELLKQ